MKARSYVIRTKVVVRCFDLAQVHRFDRAVFDGNRTVFARSVICDGQVSELIRFS